MRPAPAPELTLRQLNRTTLLRQSLLERANEDVAARVMRIACARAASGYSSISAVDQPLASFQSMVPVKQ